MTWWRMNQFKYPQMAKIACQYLSIPASEVGVEQLFSQEHDLLELHQYALQPATIKMLTVLKAFQSNKYWLEVTTDIKKEIVEADIDIEIEHISK